MSSSLLISLNNLSIFNGLLLQKNKRVISNSYNNLNFFARLFTLERISSLLGGKNEPVAQIEIIMV
jgi:hypothetical protein